MINKALKYLLIFFVSFVFVQKANGLEDFNFNITSIEILEDGNVFKGINKGIITTNDGLTIEADTFEYNKALNIFKAKGNIKIEDAFKKYVIYSDNLTYIKNDEIINTLGNSKAFYKNGIIIKADIFEYKKINNILYAKNDVTVNYPIKDYFISTEGLKYFRDEEYVITEGKTNALIKSKFKFDSENVLFSIKKDQLSSEKKSRVQDNNSNIYLIDRFNYSLKNDLLKGENIIGISNYNLPKSDKIYFSSAIINLDKNEFTAKDTEFNSHNEVFGNPENNPRLKGISSKKVGNLTTINKGIFTSCKKNDKCPPWSIQAEEIVHDKNKKQLIYNNALLKIYDLPILYFPKFFHPDPTVKRQSGLLRPHLNNSNLLGNSVTIPYFFAHSSNKDFTFTPTFYDENIQMFQTEYREVGKNFNFITDIGFTRGYKSSTDNKKKNINHIFTNLNLNLDLDGYENSDLNLKIEKVSNDTYLKIFDSNIYTDTLKPENFNILKSEIILQLNSEKYNFETGFQSYENLTLSNNDRYEYILPYYNYSKILSDNFMNGLISFASSGSNELKNTNNLRSKAVNDLSYNSLDLISKHGFKNNFNINFKNLISAGKNDSEYDSNPDLKIMSNLEFVTSLPMTKKNENFLNYLTPKVSFRFNPTDMKHYSSLEKKINIDNIFSNNRIGVDDTLETGESVTVGIDYKKQKLDDINKYFEMKLGTVFRNDEENDIPKSSTLNKKNSNLFGSISNNFSEYLKLDYNFSLDNDYKTFESNEVIANLSVNNFATEFNFIKESGDIGDTNILENQTTFAIDENNVIQFKTRRNRKINLTEYYDLVYEYKNDCLTAGIKYNKTYYEDRDLKPSENIFFTISLYPLTRYEQKFNQ